jgi:tetratricopeptide (TPR) repeat protein
MLTARGSQLLVTVLASSCILLGGCGGAQSRYASHMKRGQDYFDQGDFSKANVEFRNALQIEPKDSIARLAAGRALVHLDRPREAWGAFQAVVDADPNNLEARTELARLFIMAGSIDQGMKVLEPGLKAHPDDVALLSLRAAARARLQDHAGAIADAEHALKLAPDNEEAIQVRAGLFKQAGDVASARALVDGAVRKSPKSIALREMLVDLALSAHDPAQAEQQLSEIIKLAPQEPEYRFRLAMLYSRTNELDKAQHVLEDAVQAFPKRDEPKLALVDFVSRQRTAAQGQKMLQDFIAREPDDYGLRFALGAMLQRSNATKDAIAVYDEVVRRDDTGPSGLAARDRLAQIAATQGHDADARKLLAQVLEKNPHDNDALALRASLEMAHTEPTAAIGDLRALLRDNPQAPGVQRLLGRAYLANGQPELAQQALEAAVDLAPADTSMRVELGQMLMQIQKPDQAIPVLEEAVRRAPSDTAPRTELVRAHLDKQDFRGAHAAAADLKLLNPQSAAGFYLSGMAALGLNQPDEARSELEQALALEPKSIDVLSALARLDMARGQPARAVTLVKTASDNDPGNAALLNLLGEIYAGEKNAPAATDALARAVTILPAWWVPHRNLALVKLAQQDVPGAITEYQAAVKAAPAAQLRVVGELAQVYESQHRVDDAIALYEASYHKNPQPVIANNLAALLVSYKSDHASLDRARDLTASFASSNDGTLLDTSGWVHFKRGEFSEAVPILARAADRSPASKEIRYHLGMAELRAGQTERARADLEAAVEGSTKYFGSDEARTALASLKGRAG